MWCVQLISVNSVELGFCRKTVFLILLLCFSIPYVTSLQIVLCTLLKVLAALAQDGEAIRFASPQLQNNLAVVMAAVQQSGWALEFVLEEWHHHPQVVHAAVSQEGGALACAAEQFHSDRAIVLAAVSAPHEDPWREATALYFASPELQADKVCLL
jgi:uncharacterized membrane protein affecting hemolysin expression